MNEQNTYSEITPEILNLAKRCASIDRIDEELYRKYEVKRGLRDISGKGVLAGLTDISEIISYTIEDNDMIPCEGRLFYRGYNIQDLVGGLIRDKRFGYEEIAYLLLSGSLPDEKELTDFSRLIGEYRTLPTSFVRDIILKAPSQDMMNTLARSVLTLYCLRQPGGRYLPSQRAAPVHPAHRSFPGLERLRAIRPTAITMTETAFSSIPRCPAFPRRRISFTFSGPTANIRSWKPGFWILC